MFTAGVGDRARSETVVPLLVAAVTLLLTNLFGKSIATFLYPWYWVSLTLPLAVVTAAGDRRNDQSWTAPEWVRSRLNW